MELTTERLCLREFVEADWPATHVYESDPAVMRYQSRDVFTPEQSREYIRGARTAAVAHPRKTYDLAVTLPSWNGALVGRVGLDLRSAEDRDACVWFMIDRRYWNQGLTTEAARALVDFGFAKLQLHRVWGDCDPRNVGSARVMEKLGMQKEAHFRQNVWIKGEWCDSLIYAILAPEWRARAGG